MTIQYITTNFGNKDVRHEELTGRDYLVVPMTMLAEGIHKGSRGPLFYPASELAKTPVAWNMKPIVVYHPAGGTATTPSELAARQVGIVMNARWEGGKLKAEAWLEEERLKAVEPDILETLEGGRTMEVSTGLFTDNVANPGAWNGEAYDFVATNHRPDHLAILPTGVGACSVADGCGLLQLNQESEDDMTHDEGPLTMPTMNFNPAGCGCRAADNAPLVAPAEPPRPLGPLFAYAPHTPPQAVQNAADGGGGDGEALALPVWEW